MSGNPFHGADNQIPSTPVLADPLQRLAKLEAKMEGVATKADLHQMETKLIKWMMGTIITTSIALTAVVARTFF